MECLHQKTGLRVASLHTRSLLHASSSSSVPRHHLGPRSFRCSWNLAAASCPVPASAQPKRIPHPPKASVDAPALTIDNCTVLVVGEHGVGMDVVRRLARAGSWVTAFHDAEGYRKEIEGLGAMLALGEPTAGDKVAKALRSNQFDAIIYSISADSPDSVSSLDAQLTVIMAAREAKIPKFLLVSSIGAEDEETLASVEANLREGSADLKWTIIRTGPLLPQGSGAGSATLSEDAGTELRAVAASDLAALISQILFDADFEGKVLSAIKLEQ